jgi:flagellar biosynthesis/type III secretory pathway M-ring protein FliF/YscJ
MRPDSDGDSGWRDMGTVAKVISIVLAVLVITAMVALVLILRSVRYTGT